MLSVKAILDTKSMFNLPSIYIDRDEFLFIKKLKWNCTAFLIHQYLGLSNFFKVKNQKTLEGLGEKESRTNFYVPQPRANFRARMANFR